MMQRVWTGGERVEPRLEQTQVLSWQWLRPELSSRFWWLSFQRAQGPGGGRRRHGLRVGLLLGMVGLFSGTTRAQDANSRGIEIQQFLPSSDTSEFVTTTGSSIQPAEAPHLGLWLNYAHRPLVVFEGSSAAAGANQTAVLIQDALAAHLVGAVGLARSVDLSFNLPFNLYQTSPDTLGTLEPAEQSLGDLQVHLKWRFFDNPDILGLALRPTVILPTGNGNDYTGADELNLALTLVADKSIGEFLRLGLNVGYRYRPTTVTLAEQVIDDALTYRLGAAVRLNDYVSLLGEVYGSQGVLNYNGNPPPSPLEALFAARFRADSGLSLTGGVGAGVLEGPGIPDFRLLLGLTFSPDPLRDRDKDGIVDKLDACLTEPEDKDDFQDQDGCPELDNDNDGIIDLSDKCPLDPEDKDGFEDGDGCFDPDNDLDGIVDTRDQCPAQPEDRDAYLDSDGCPDPDNDNDGLLDAEDRCPLDPEDSDGFLDGDGCPDPDNDGDGVLDAGDSCPNELEDLDNFEDLDGCPEPDNDQDGIFDVNDACPTLAETFNQLKDDDGCPDSIEAEKVEIKEGKLILLDKIYFELDQAVIQPQSYDILNQTIKILQLYPEIQVVIEGHTDDQGPDVYNLDLSQRRADAVKQYVVETGKLDAERFRTLGKGETQPVVPNDSEPNRALNRRIEWILSGQQPDSSLP